MAKIAESRSMLNVLISVFVTPGSFSYGYSASIIASTLGQSHFISHFNLVPVHNPNANALLGATNGLFQTGGLLGALSIGYCADRFSRRAASIISSLILCVGGALQAASQNISMFLAMLFFTGMGVGQIAGAVPLYQSEISPPHSRGLLVCLHGVLIGTGYSIAGWVGYACYPLSGSLQWRIPLALQVVTPALLCIGTLFLPESPRWLLQNDRPDEALDVLKRLHANVQDTEFQFARKEFHDMQQQLSLEKTTGKDSYMDLLTQKGLLKRVIVGFLTMFGAQCTGTLVPLLGNVTVLYSNVGYDGRTAIAFTAGWVTVSIAGNAITAIFVDKLGRVKFMIIGFTGIVCVLIGEIVCLALLESRESYGLSLAAIAFLYGHIAFFSSCIDATTYIYASEIFPTHLRARGLSLSLSGLFLVSLCFTQAATSALASIGWRYYILFTVMSALMVLVLFFYFPETKGLSLEEMAKLFGDEVATDVAASVPGEAILEAKGSQAQEMVSEHCERV
ncbi:general substrate transporter [Fusarium venenatum]|uniref:general substrate transporter n=1 Tax=Fusarium venenatum TaxID=56646 RepID=UPI001D8F0223|nr:general substrate transporter [Fusarium venenatum]